PLSDCNFCTAKRQEQQKYIQSIESKVNPDRSKSPEATVAPLARRTSNGVNNGVIYIPLFMHGVRGKESLNELAEIMFSKGRQNG
ncbi:MAG: hypothetical protein COZ07_06375, partial [Candidatus Infernicultor aquiphilus]